MPDSYVQAAATTTPETVSISLQPKNASLVKGYSVGDAVSVAFRGKVTSVSQSDYGASLTVELDLLSVKQPAPETFIEQVDAAKVLKA